MGAVAIIALAYTDQISTIALGGAALVLGLLYVLGKSGVRALPVYAIGVVALWYCVLLSGVHATIAGVAAALVIPIRSEERRVGKEGVRKCRSRGSPFH